MSHQKCINFTKIICVIFLLIQVDRGSSLKCYECDSGPDGNCVGTLEEELLEECTNSEPVTPTTTTTPSTTTTPTTTTPTTTTPTTTTPTTTATPETTKTPPIAPAPETTKTPPIAPAPETTKTPPIAPTPETTKTPPTAPPQPKPDPPAVTPGKPGDEESNYSAKRVRRSARPSHRAEDEFMCYSYEEKDPESEELKTKRGCAPRSESGTFCDSKENCDICEEDGCNNSASSAKLGLLSIFLPILFTVITVLNR